MTRVFSIVDMVFESSESNSVWSGVLNITNPDDFAVTAEGDEVVLNVGNEEYNLIVLTKSINRSDPARISMRINVASRLVLKDAPRAAPQTYSFDTPMSAWAMVEEILGETVEWELVDWMIPAGRVKFEEVVPLAAARRVVEAAGGIIQSKPDGTILVRSLFPIATNFYATATPDHVFTDDDDNLSASANYEYRDQFNQFRISEAETAQGDRFEWVPSEGSVLIGTLRFYPSPWRETATIRTTEPVAGTTYTPMGVVSRMEEDEEVEFRDGIASLKYPIFGAPTVEWLSSPLGAVTHVDFGTSLTAPRSVNGGYGLARVTYRVRAIEFAVTGVDGTSVQFIAEEL